MLSYTPKIPAILGTEASSMDFSQVSRMAVRDPSTSAFNLLPLRVYISRKLELEEDLGLGLRHLYGT